MNNAVDAAVCISPISELRGQEQQCAGEAQLLVMGNG